MVKFAAVQPKVIGVSKLYRGCQLKSKITKCLIAGILMFLIFITGMFLGSFRTYERGYEDGRKVTNAWWIDKQSRYYDADEVEKKRRDSQFNQL